jgi:hypothetical protein
LLMQGLQAVMDLPPPADSFVRVPGVESSPNILAAKQSSRLVYPVPRVNNEPSIIEKTSILHCSITPYY